MDKKITHFLYVPLLGLGLYGGHRGNRWLKNRIKIFKQFVVPSLIAQTSKEFVLWVSVRHEDRNDKTIKAFKQYLEDLPEIRVVFTYSGICFWDDKYPDEKAHDRLIHSLHGALGELLTHVNDSEEVLMTIQPSDDCYHKDMVLETREFFKNNPGIHVYGYGGGYVMDYLNRRLCEWNPETTPPFYTIRFPRAEFVDPYKHTKYIGPYKSHEYVKDFLPAHYSGKRGFIVGTHGENISTIFGHPFAGHEFLGDNIDEILVDFGLRSVEKLTLKPSFRKWFMRQLPYGWRRKLRYLFGERFAAKLYNWIRS